MNESELLTRARCEEIFGRVRDAARSEGVNDIEVMVGVGSSALTRFSNNAIHQNVAERGGYISVRALIDGRTARASGNQFAIESTRLGTEAPNAITRLQAADADLLPLAEPGPVADIDRFFPSTAAEG